MSKSQVPKTAKKVVDAWILGRRRTVTGYKTDGSILWYKGQVAGITLMDGSKVAVSLPVWKAFYKKMSFYQVSVARWGLNLNSNVPGNHRVQAMWSMVERMGMCPVDNRPRFHTLAEAGGVVVYDYGEKPKYHIKPLKKSSLLTYCPKCVTNKVGSNLAGWKRVFWGSGVKKIMPLAWGIKDNKAKSCLVCGTVKKHMTAEGAKLYWMIYSHSLFGLPGAPVMNDLTLAISKGK